MTTTPTGRLRPDAHAVSGRGRLRARRLAVAGNRSFAPGAGAARRAAIDEVTRTWLTGLFEDAGGGGLDGVALAAVGSLGRHESGPLSDLDLVLLHDGRALGERALGELADRLWYPLWESGLKLDHSVRSVRESRRVADVDLPALVGLLELDRVAGDELVVAAARTTVGHDWRARARERLPELLGSVRARHERYGELAQSQVLDLKEGRGGLRDVTVLAALTAAWLTDRTRVGVAEAHTMLLDVRDAVQVVTGRPSSRLRMEDRDAVAALLGFTDPDDLLAEVARAGDDVTWALEMTMRRARQASAARALRVGPRRPTLVPLGHGVHEHDGEAVLGAGADTTDPVLPLRTAVVAARAGLPLSPATLTTLAGCPDLPTPWPPLARELLTDLLGSGDGLRQVWAGLVHAGLVERWLPEWSAVRSRPQHNPVHRHTVDRHTVEAVVQAAAGTRDVARADLLVLSALLHDIGKVAGAHDHSEEGARRAGPILARWGWPEDDAAVVVRLVREHLTLVDLATRRDVEDPATTEALLTAVDRRADILDLLTALSRADARAAGPGAWTPWRSTLVDTLTASARRAITRGTDEPGTPLEPDTVSVDEDARATLAAGRSHVVTEPTPGGHRVRVLATDRAGLFSRTAAVLAADGMTIRRARLWTADGVADDVWDVELPGGGAPDPERIRRALDRREPPRHRAAPRRGHAPAGPPARAFVVPGGSWDATVLEVRADDRVGLLADLGEVVAGHGCSLRSAHVSTRAGQACDTLVVTGADGRALAPGASAALLGDLMVAADGPDRG